MWTGRCLQMIQIYWLYLLNFCVFLCLCPFSSCPLFNVLTVVSFLHLTSSVLLTLLFYIFFSLWLFRFKSVIFLLQLRLLLSYFSSCWLICDHFLNCSVYKMSYSEKCLLEFLTALRCIHIFLFSPISRLKTKRYSVTFIYEKDKHQILTSEKLEKTIDY